MSARQDWRCPGCGTSQPAYHYGLCPRRLGFAVPIFIGLAAGMSLGAAFAGCWPAAVMAGMGAAAAALGASS